MKKPRAKYPASVSGYVAPGFEHVRVEFEQNLAEIRLLQDYRTVPIDRHFDAARLRHVLQDFDKVFTVANAALR